MTEPDQVSSPSSKPRASKFPPLLVKAFVTALVILILAQALSMIMSLIDERQQRGKEARDSVAASFSGEQTMIGPILVIPYAEDWTEKTRQDKETIITKYHEEHALRVYPEALDLNGDINVSKDRRRGIFEVRTYEWQNGAINGEFEVPADLPRPASPDHVVTQHGAPYLALSLSDVRGLHSAPALTWNGTAYAFAQGSGLPGFTTGIHAPLVDLVMGKAAQRSKFSIRLTLAGIEKISFAPTGTLTRATFTSNWASPQFAGSFLPNDYSVSDSGFHASWVIPALATQTRQKLEQQFSKDYNNAVELECFNVGLIEPINIYSESTRAAKYGLLFVVLTFAAFFLFEVLQRTTIHAVQYTLVGLALTIFYLLLVSLSEHVAFMWAYLAAATACIMLLGFYVSYVLGRYKRGIVFGLGLTVLYGGLYVLLQSENDALILGSTLLFVLLALVMFITRKVDWSKIGSGTVEQGF